MRFSLSHALTLAILAGSAFAQPTTQPATPPASPPPVQLKGLEYNAEFFPGATHDPAVPTPDSILGFRAGDKPMTYAQVQAILKALAASPAKTGQRVKLFDYATSHEGRTLSYLAISSPANIARLDEIKAAAAKLADPRAIPAAEADALARDLPIIVVLAYVIHGDEMSGTDAAMPLAWHLASCTDPAVTAMLDKMVIIFDPLMNPDGRERCITSVAQSRTRQPNVDDQSIFHAQPWPGGRMNHYLFDLNRDWMFATQPESRGRVKAFGEWNAHYFVESHEQSPLDTFLFMPPRAPINPNIGDHIKKWSAIFGDDQGKAFDAFGWRYYTGEWNEEWYPGYSGSWAALRGAIDNLYEQARLISDGVRRPEGTIEAYREGVHKQLVSSLANLATASKHREVILKDFVEDRRKVIAGGGDPEAGGVATRHFILEAPAGNVGRWQKLIDNLELQGIEVLRTAEKFKTSGKDPLGREFKDREFAAGTVVISANQPLGRLAAALFELDPRMPKEFLIEERRELLRFGQSRLYDITGWNVGMFFGMDVFEVRGALPASAAPAKWDDLVAPARAAAPVQNPVAMVLSAADDRSVAAAARLLELGVKIRASDKPTVLGSKHERGSFFMTRIDNRDVAGWDTLIRETAASFGVIAEPVGGGMGPGDLPDLGGQHFVLLEPPRVAVLARAPMSPYSYGEIWHLLDHEMGVRASYIDADDLGGSDLRRYNVLVIPDGGSSWTEHLPAIRSWVESGGTVIAIGDSAAPFAKEKDGIGSVRLLPDVLTKLDAYRAAVVRDWLGKTAVVEPDAVWSYNPPEKLEYPWELGEAEKVDEDEAKRRDQWRSLFMPQGAFLASRTDDRHWLTSGCGETLPVLVGQGPVLLAPHGGNAPVLLGAFVPSTKPPEPKPEPAKDGKNAGEEKKQDKKDEDKKDAKKEEPKPGWLLAPPGYELRLRMSGLLWPEAADRLAHSAYCTQERVGAGQVILFSGNPTFRSAARGTTRLFMNAVVMGPGMGASPAIKP
ncbi:MAG: hypothetical protein HEQ23_04285 [Tepidisphaera sp.]